MRRTRTEWMLGRRGKASFWHSQRKKYCCNWMCHDTFMQMCMCVLATAMLTASRELLRWPESGLFCKASLREWEWYVRNTCYLISMPFWIVLSHSPPPDHFQMCVSLPFVRLTPNLFGFIPFSSFGAAVSWLFICLSWFWCFSTVRAVSTI